LRGQITKDRLGKLFIPFVVLGLILLGHYWIGFRLDAQEKGNEAPLSVY
jgi:hypothetical protein